MSSVNRMQPEQFDPGLEIPVEDAAEQSTFADPVEAAEAAEGGVEATAGINNDHRGLEVGEWDATEQSRTVDLTDEYR